MAEHLQKSGIDISGHLENVRGIYHIKLSWVDEAGKRCRKSVSTGLAVRGNKTRAEKMIAKAKMELEEELTNKPAAKGMLFADFMEKWLDVIRNDKSKPLKPTTFGSYQMNVQRVIAPYFRAKGTMLSELTADDINEFYSDQLERVKAMTVTKFHANISKALKYAVRMDYIPFSFMDKVDRPSPERFVGKFLRESEVVELLDAVKGHKLELGVIFGAFYGLRRSEVMGLRWESINFEANTITIEHTVTEANIDGHHVIVADDTTKSKSSFRTLPLVPIIRAKLLAVKEEQEVNRKLCGRSYNKENIGYIYTDPLGNRIKPNYISGAFPGFLEKNGLKRLRFHDLRHVCASLLLANGVPLKAIQEWLGHSDFGLTANIYSHLEYTTKVASAEAMTWLKDTALGKEASLVAQGQGIPEAEAPAEAAGGSGA